MKLRVLLIVAVVCASLLGCEKEKPIDDSKPAPPPTYHMVPSQKDPNYKG